LIKVAAIFLFLGGIASLLLGVSNAHGQQQGNQFLPSTTQTLPSSIQQQPPPTAKFNPPIQQQPQQQLPNQQQQYSPQLQGQFNQPQQQQQLQQLFNPESVVACMDKVLDDSIIKASSLTIKNDFNHNITIGITEPFIANQPNIGIKSLCGEMK
jgi:hypothetical protein